MIDATLLAQLRAALPGQAVVTGTQLQGRTEDWRRQRLTQAQVVLRPTTTHEVSQALALCNAVGQSVVTQGGLTGLVHGADSHESDVIMSLERMRSIESIDPVQRIAVVQAGVSLQQLQEAADQQGLSFPLDLGARGSATLGGNVSTNAGGNRVLRFGMMRDMVLGLEAVLADGTVIPALNRLIKNNSGYDLKQLFIGAEGTLGVVTRVVLRLREKPLFQAVAFAAVPSFAALSGLLKHLDRELGGGLSAFEVMWPAFYELVTTPPANGRAPLPHGAPFYVLIEALSGDSGGEARLQAALERALQQQLIVDVAIAQSQANAAALWALRDDVAQTARWGAPMTFDVSLPTACMPEYVDSVTAALCAQWPQVRIFVFGHLGDGNLHLVVSPDGLPTDAQAVVERIIYAPLPALNGAVSAEHGIGVEKKRWLPLSRSAAEIELMRLLKHALDPKGILNPGCIL